MFYFFFFFKYTTTLENSIYLEMFFRRWCTKRGTLKPKPQLQQWRTPDQFLREQANSWAIPLSPPHANPRERREEKKSMADTEGKPGKRTTLYNLQEKFY
jgi:hypothetical protein